jgi:hypothetical protein
MKTVWSSPHLTLTQVPEIGPGYLSPFQHAMVSRFQVSRFFHTGEANGAERSPGFPKEGNRAATSTVKGHQIDSLNTEFRSWIRRQSSFAL